MAETSTPSQRPSDVARLQRAERTRVALTAGAIVLALAFALWLLRFHRLSELPPGIQSDEGADGVYALQVLQGDHAIFFPEKASGREAIGVYAIALTTALFGRTLLAFHLPTALASAATVFIVFWLGWLLFGHDAESKKSNPWQGPFIGGFGAGLMAVSVSQLFLSRAALRANFLPLLLSLSLALLWLGWRQRSWTKLALAGACAGLLPYTYLAARFTPFLFVFYSLSFLKPFGHTAIGKVRAELPRIGTFLVAGALLAAPILIHFALNPEHLFIRSGQLWVFGEEQGNPVVILLRNVWEYLLAFGFRGDLIGRYNFAGEPLLNLWQAIFFWLGVGAAIRRWRHPAFRLLLLWLGVMILPGILAATRGMGPNFLRMSGAAPAIFLLTGVGMWEACQYLMRHFSALQESTGYSLLANRSVPAAAIGALAVATVLYQGVDSYRTFFLEWPGSPASSRAYQTEWTDVAGVLNAQPSEMGTTYVIPYPKLNEHYADEHFGFEYLYRGTMPVHIVHATTPHNLAQRIQFALAAEENVSTLKYLDWDNGFVGGDARAEDHVTALLSKYGRFLHIEEFERFRFHVFTDVVLDKPWQFYEPLEDLDIHFDGGISLFGYAYGQGTQQLSPPQQVNPGETRHFWVALLWQTAPKLELEYSISLRLHIAGGEKVHQQDYVLRNQFTNTTRDWVAEEPVDTLHYLDLPPDLPAGEYELRLVVYDFESLKPTVELGVWEPETTIARIHFGESN